jgi:hypothetical protein
MCTWLQCGMLNYPSGSGSNVIFIPTSELAAKTDCRAHKVFSAFIPVIMARYNIEEEDVFLFEPKTKVKGGVTTEGHTLFSCGYCMKEERRDPAQYDLFDGVDASGVVKDIGIGDVLEPALRSLSADERLSLSVLKVFPKRKMPFHVWLLFSLSNIELLRVQMADATFTAYGGGPSGYHHASGGGTLVPADFRGLSAMLLRSPATGNLDSEKLRTAIAALRDGGNEIIRNTLTCLERLNRGDDSDRFPTAAGGASGMPSVVEADVQADAFAAARACDGDVGGVAAALGAPAGPGGLSGSHAGLLGTPDAMRFTGALHTVNDIDPSAALERNAIEKQEAGNVRRRNDPTTDEAVTYEAGNPAHCAENAVHTVLYSKGEGGRLKTETACSSVHFRKLRLAGVNDRFSNAIEFLWYHFQDMNKRALHSRGPRLVDSTVASGLTNSIMHRHSTTVQAAHQALQAANPGLVAHVTPVESLSGGVSKSVVGGKAYWKEVRDHGLSLR